MKSDKGLLAILRHTVRQMIRRPIYWFGFFGIPLFMFLFITSMMESGLPQHIPAALVDRDGTELSRNVGRTLNSMELANITRTPGSYSAARDLMQRGEIYGFFLIPENFEADMLAGRAPAITFYYNMAYFVPGSMLFKSFKTTAVLTKAGVALKVADAVGADAGQLMPMIQPVNIQARAIGNPSLNYGIYLGNSFIPGILQLMIMLMTVYSIGEEIKRHTSPALLRMGNGSILEVIFGKLLPQTIVWWVIACFMVAWLYYYNGYTMQCPLWVMLLSELLFVLASQGFAIFVFGVLPSLRLAMSICSLLGVLSFSIAAFSFPVESMYPALKPFTYIMPVRYNFLIYADQALAGRELYFSRWWFAAYFIFILIPFIFMRRIKKAYADPVYVP